MDAEGTPSNQLDPRVKPMWRIQAAVVGVPLFIISLAVTGGLAYAGASAWIIAAIPLVALAFVIASVGPFPEVRFRRWRWEVNELEVRLQHGLFIIERTVIPMVRVQHVDTSQGPIMRTFSLSEVRITTAAGPHSIPALADADAAALRDRIATLARVTDDGGL